MGSLKSSILLAVLSTWVASAVTVEPIVGNECEYSKITICRDLVSRWVFLPNLFQHTSQTEISQSKQHTTLVRFSILTQSWSTDKRKIKRNCKMEIERLACSVLTPKCKFSDPLQSFASFPCPSLCKSIRQRCEPVLFRNNVKWPSFLPCERTPRSKCLRKRRFQVPKLPRKSSHSHRNRMRLHHRHHDSHAKLRKSLKQVVEVCPDVARLYKIGKSVEDRSLLVLEFSTHQGQELRPAVKLIGNIHGDEVLGRELLINLAKYLCHGWYTRNSEIVRLIQSTRLHILASMNPDGHARAVKNNGTNGGYDMFLSGRTNTNHRDLNRAFPDLTSYIYYYAIYNLEGPNNHLSIPMSYQMEKKKLMVPESVAVLNWIKRYPFVLSAQLHGGAVVANYPYDLRFPVLPGVQPRNSNYVATPDDEVFRYLTSTYAKKHRTMSDPTLNVPCDDAYPDEDFGKTGGVTNGADWYSVRGGMQDFNYLHTNCFEITLELGCDKYTKEEDLEREWDNNIGALLAYIDTAHTGIKGMVFDGKQRPIENAIINVKRARNMAEIKHDITTTVRGEYWRILTIGEYIVTASKQGYEEVEKRVSITNHEEPLIVNFLLQRRLR